MDMRHGRGLRLSSSQSASQVHSRKVRGSGCHMNLTVLLLNSGPVHWNNYCHGVLRYTLIWPLSKFRRSSVGGRQMIISFYSGPA
eukprot:g17137.t1